MPLDPGANAESYLRVDTRKSSTYYYYYEGGPTRYTDGPISNGYTSSNTYDYKYYKDSTYCTMYVAGYIMVYTKYTTYVAYLDTVSGTYYYYKYYYSSDIRHYKYATGIRAVGGKDYCGYKTYYYYYMSGTFNWVSTNSGSIIVKKNSEYSGIEFMYNSIIAGYGYYNTSAYYVPATMQVTVYCAYISGTTYTRKYKYYYDYYYYYEGPFNDTKYSYTRNYILS